MVYADLRRHGYAHYSCQLSVIGTPPYADKAAQVQADYVKMVETAVQDQPETWLAWAMVVV